MHHADNDPRNLFMTRDEWEAEREEALFDEDGYRLIVDDDPEAKLLPVEWSSL